MPNAVIRPLVVITLHLEALGCSILDYIRPLLWTALFLSIFYSHPTTKNLQCLMRESGIELRRTSSRHYLCKHIRTTK